MARLPVPSPVTITSRLVLPLITQLRLEGHAVEPMLERLGLDEAQLRSLQGRLTMETFLDVHTACVATTGDPSFPLRAATSLDRDSFPLAFYLVGSQATVRDGAHFVEPFTSTFVDGIGYDLVSTGDMLHVDFTLRGAPLRPPVFAEYLLVMVLKLGHRLMPGQPPPTRVEFAHRWPRHGEDLSRFFGGAPVVFGADGVRYVFPELRFDMPIVGSDPALGALLAQSASDWLARESTNDPVRDRVRRFLTSRVPFATEPSANELADSLRMSERTLRRKLADEGTSLRALLDDVRKERAVALLERGESADTIAYELGFSNANAFRRAFKRWTGSAPMAYSVGPSDGTSGEGGSREGGSGDRGGD